MKALHPVVETLRDARMEAHVSQKELAQRAGTVQSAISEIESGTAVPLITTADRIAKALGLTLVLVPTVDS
jgi:transcriptional regulator with XRE-family HTH domain